MENEVLLVDAQGTPYAKLHVRRSASHPTSCVSLLTLRTQSGSFNLGAKATGSNFSKRIGSAPQATPPPKDRKPDWVVRDQTTPEQAVIYRLSGDYNELHISASPPFPLSYPMSSRCMLIQKPDPAIGASTGFGGVILHGLATFGFGARAIISSVGGGDPRALTLFGVRFTAPVKPGDALETSIWEIGPAKAKGHEGETEVAFVTTNVATGKVRMGRVGVHRVGTDGVVGVFGRGRRVCEEGGEEQALSAARRRRLSVLLYSGWCVRWTCTRLDADSLFNMESTLLVNPTPSSDVRAMNIPLVMLRAYTALSVILRQVRRCE